MSLYGPAAVTAKKLKNAEKFGTKVSAFVQATGMLWQQIKSKVAGMTPNTLINALPEVAILLAVISPDRPLTALVQLPLSNEARESVQDRADAMLNQTTKTAAQNNAAEVAKREAAKNPIKELYCTAVADDQPSFLQVAVNLLDEQDMFTEKIVVIDGPCSLGDIIHSLFADINQELDHFVAAFQRQAAATKAQGKNPAMDPKTPAPVMPPPAAPPAKPSGAATEE
eukprot:2113762-Amphidinium_carterae.1